MSELQPLPIPPFGYVSHGPYTICAEWVVEGIAHLVTGTRFDLCEALFAFHNGAVTTGPDAPDRRVLVDVRGVTILGYCPVARIDAVVTDEVLAMMAETGLSEGVDHLDLLDLELNMMVWGER